jgi:cob(I)alamin adenosyltransferase
VGLARAAGLDPELDTVLGEVQAQLFVVGADLATPGESGSIPRVSAAEVAFLEGAIDHMEDLVEPLRQFILPGGTQAAAQLHVARTVCRRAERWAVSLAREEQLSAEVLAYLNRLSDFLFVAARAANARAGTPDVPWVSPRLGAG